MIPLLLTCMAAWGEPPRFRVYDATDQKPIAGAMLELWTEEGAKPLGPTTRLGVLHSGADGTGEFAYDVNGLRYDNIRVSKPGYASHSVTLSDLEEGVELYPASPLVGRVVDLAGQPVAGAIVRTRETCAHAVSAAETTTDVDGRFVLADCPADPQQAELEVLPRAHVPIWELQIDVLRRLQARDGSFDLFVARKPPIRATLLDEKGQPLAGRRVGCEVRPYLAAWSNAEGVVELTPQPQWDAKLELRGPGTQLVVHSASIPGSGELRTRFFVERDATRAGALTLEHPPLPEGTNAPRLLVIDSEGTNAEGTTASGLAPGPATVIVGQDFSPWVEERRTVEITGAAQTLPVTPRRALAVNVTVPEGWAAMLMIQAGSTGFRVDSVDDPTHALHVPPDVELVFLATTSEGEVRRVRHPGAKEGALTIDLSAPSTIVRQGTPFPEGR